MPACCRHTAGILPYPPHNMLHDVPVPYRGLYNFSKAAEDSRKIDFFLNSVYYLLTSKLRLTY